MPGKIRHELLRTEVVHQWLVCVLNERGKAQLPLNCNRFRRDFSGAWVLVKFFDEQHLFFLMANVELTSEPKRSFGESSERSERG